MNWRQRCREGLAEPILTDPRPGEKRGASTAASERKLQAALREAVSRVGEDHPVVVRCLGIVLDIATGKLRGRNIQVQLRACTEMLDRLIGKAEQPIVHRGDSRSPVETVFRIEHATGVPITRSLAHPEPAGLLARGANGGNGKAGNGAHE